MKVGDRLALQFRTPPLLPLLKKGFWAVSDQALFAGSNFLLNIMLVRWLTAAEYGAFAIAYTVYIFIDTVHTGLLTEPMLVFGAGRFEKRSGPYLGALLCGHGGLTVVAGMVLAAAGIYFHLAGSGVFAAALFGLALAQPLMLYNQLMRRAAYVRRRPRLATAGSSIYLLAVGASLFILYQLWGISIFAALLIMAAASLAAGFFVANGLGVRFQTVEAPLRREVMRRHWQYGRWAVATGVLTWVPGNAYLLIVSAWGGLADAGILKALLNLVQPVLHANHALAALLVPELVKAREAGNFQQVAGLTTVGLGTAALVYWGLIGFFGTDIAAWLYNASYESHALVLWLLGALPVVEALRIVLLSAIRAMERPDGIFWAYLAATLVTLTAGLALAVWYGLIGAALGMLLSTFAASVGLAWFLIRHYRRRETASGFLD